MADTYVIVGGRGHLRLRPLTFRRAKETMLHQQNNQKTLPPDREPDGTLVVHEIFESIQGEGPFVGYPTTFIRLMGCNLQCPECDTKYTGPSANRMVLSDIGSKLNSLPHHKLVVITGGEPFRQNITPLVKVLLRTGHIVQIETNGTLFLDNGFPWHHPAVYIVCSPKTGKLHPRLIKHVTAFKYVLSHTDVAVDGLPEQALGHPLRGYDMVARPPGNFQGAIYIQPMDDGEGSDHNLQAAAESVLEHKKYILGIQLHKLAGLP